jgi:hypothetical protein
MKLMDSKCFRNNQGKVMCKKAPIFVGAELTCPDVDDGHN